MIKKIDEDNPEFYDRIIAETDNGEQYTYYDLKLFSDKLGQKTVSRSTVFVLCEHCIGELFGVLSFLRNKVVMYLLDSKLPQERINALLAEYTPNYMYVPEKKKENYKGFHLVFEEYGMALLKNDMVQRELVKNDRLAFFLSTSGSTGTSKLVRLAYDNYEAVVEREICISHISPDSVTATFLPIQFAYGLGIILSHVSVGAKIIITKMSVTQNRFWKLCDEKKITYFYGVPYMYENICNLGIEDYLKRFRVISVAGGKLKMHVSLKCTRVAADNHVLFINEYGQTEASCMSFQIKSENGSYHPEENIGESNCDGKMYLLDADKKVITEQNVRGELMYEGKTAAMGYCRTNKEIDAEDSWCKVIDTGDIAIINDLGKIEIVGRAKRFIKIYGKRYSLDHIEHIMNQEIQKGQVVTSGCDGMLVIFTDTEENIESCKKYIHSKYGISESNFQVEYLKEFPLNDNGKIAYAELLKYVNEKFA